MNYSLLKVNKSRYMQCLVTPYRSILLEMGRSHECLTDSAMVVRGVCKSKGLDVYIKKIIFYYQ